MLIYTITYDHDTTTPTNAWKLLNAELECIQSMHYPLLNDLRPMANMNRRLPSAMSSLKFSIFFFFFIMAQKFSLDVYNADNNLIFGSRQGGH